MHRQHVPAGAKGQLSSKEALPSKKLLSAFSGQDTPGARALLELHSHSPGSGVWMDLLDLLFSCIVLALFQGSGVDRLGFGT